MKKLLSLIVIALSTFTLFAQGVIQDGTLSFPAGTTTINNSAYQTNQSIKHIQFPSTLKTIGTSAFRFCVYIDDDLVLPEGLETIGKLAFYNCVNIHKITVPSSVVSIGESAFSKNTVLIVIQGSHAHDWAVANGYDYQYPGSTHPVGVSIVYRDYFLKTAWNQRGGSMQLSPNKEKVLCGNLADAAIMYYHGLRYHGSKSYATSKDIYYADFDKNQADLTKIPRYFAGSLSEQQMYDADLFLWNQCMVDERSWNSSSVQSPVEYIEAEMEHMPAKVEMFYLKQNDSETDGDYKTKEELEKIIRENMFAMCPMMMYARQLGGGSNHGWVIDGLRKKNGILQVHCNFGWNGGCDGWYNIWDPIVNDMIDYQDPYRRFRTFKPLMGKELDAWKPFELTDVQKIAVKAETAKVPYIRSNIVYLPEGTTVAVSKSYLNNTTVKGIHFPSTLRKINTSAFEGCSGITEVTIPESVEYIGVNSFKNCGNLTTIYYNARQTSYSGSGTTAFRGCINLSKVVFGNEVKVIPPFLFKFNTKLTEVTIPGSVERIGNSPFPSTTKIKCPSGSYAEAWAKQNGYKFEIVNIPAGSTITGNASGNTSGNTSGNADTGNTPTTSANNQNLKPAEIVALAKANPKGWINKPMGGNCKYLTFTKMAQDKEGNSYVIGGSIKRKDTVVFENNAKLIGNTIYGYDYMIKYDYRGQFQWARRVNGTKEGAHYTGIAVNSRGELFVCGDVGPDREYDFGNGVILSGVRKCNSAFLAKYDTDGNAIWVKECGHPDNGGSHYYSMMIDDNDNIYCGGDLWFMYHGKSTGTFEISPTVKLSINASEAALLVKYNRDGIVQWARSVEGDTDASSFNDITIDKNGNIIAAGELNDGRYVFGNEVSVTSPSTDKPIGYKNFLIVKYTASGIPRWSKASLSSGESECIALAADSQGGGVCLR